MTEQRPLRERKRQRAHDAIIDAAYALFAERGFAEVTVAEIAERAEAGRTTFFRYFGDKQEVLFAGEQRVLDRLARRRDEPTPAPTFPEALAEARAMVRRVCQEIVADPERYRLRERLIAGSSELRDRDERKLSRVTEALADTLRAGGAPAPEALLAAHLAIACYRTGRSLARADPEALTAAVDAAFDLLDRSVPDPTAHGIA